MGQTRERRQQATPPAAYVRPPRHMTSARPLVVAAATAREDDAVSRLSASGVSASLAAGCGEGVRLTRRDQYESMRIDRRASRAPYPPGESKRLGLVPAGRLARPNAHQPASRERRKEAARWK